MLDHLQSLCPLARLYQPHNLTAIRAIAIVAPWLPQVGYFDTAIHHDQPTVAQRFALPIYMTLASGVTAPTELSYDDIACASANEMRAWRIAGCRRPSPLRG